MARGKKDVKVTVTVRPDGTLDFHVHGDVNPRGAVELKYGHIDVVNWELLGNKQITFADPPIEWVDSCNGTVSNRWPIGAPLVGRPDDYTAVTIIDNSTTIHVGTLTHCYTINVMYGGAQHSHDPEVDEQGGGTTL